MAIAKVNPLSEGALAALAALQSATSPITLAELNENGAGIASAHLTALAKRGLVSSDKVEKEVVTVRTVNAYSITEAGMDYQEPAAE